MLEKEKGLRGDLLKCLFYKALSGARSGNRTRTPCKARDFKSLASTNFAIRAWMIARRAVAAQDYNERLGRVQL